MVVAPYERGPVGRVGRDDSARRLSYGTIDEARPLLDTVRENGVYYAPAQIAQSE